MRRRECQRRPVPVLSGFDAVYLRGGGRKILCDDSKDTGRQT